MNTAAEIYAADPDLFERIAATVPEPIPTADTHPFRVGLVVYRTREEAEAKIAIARELHPDAQIVLRYFDGNVRD